MRATRNQALTTGLWLCLLGIPLLGLIRQHPPQARWPLTRARAGRRPPGSLWEAALQEARRYWGQAQIVIKPELEALAAADPDVVAADTGRRQRLMARDRGGHLRRARAAAVRAVALARSPQETYEVTLWLALIECDSGNHAAELRHVRRLLALQPRNPNSWGALRRAAKCNGRRDLARQAEVALETIAGDTLSTGATLSAQSGRP